MSWWLLGTDCGPPQDSLQQGHVPRGLSDIPRRTRRIASPTPALLAPGHSSDVLRVLPQVAGSWPLGEVGST